MFYHLKRELNHSLCHFQSGSMIQDIVTANVLRKMAKHYAEQIGCGDARINLVYHQWMVLSHQIRLF